MSRTKASPGVISGLPDKNLVINGCMRVWQRGTSAAANDHRADRWRMGNGSGETVTHARQTVSDTQLPYLDGFQYCLEAACSVASSATGCNVAAASASLSDLIGCHWACDAEL